MNDPALPVVNIKHHAARLQEICAHARISRAELEEISMISRSIVHESSRIVIWAETALNPNE